MARFGFRTSPITVYDAAGAVARSAFFRVYTLVGPASYATGGVPADLSAVFGNSLLSVTVMRAYVTSTKAADPRLYKVHEAGSDLFSGRKCRIQVFNAGTATNANVLSATGSVSAVNATETGAAAVCGSLSCTGAHPNSVVAQRTNVLSAATPSKVTAVTDASVAEIAAAVNLSTITIELLCLGT